jgi:hypothetical protein
MEITTHISGTKVVTGAFVKDDRFWTVSSFLFLKSLGDEFNGLVPRDPLPFSVASRAGPPERIS